MSFTFLSVYWKWGWPAVIVFGAGLLTVWLCGRSLWSPARGFSSLRFTGLGRKFGSPMFWINVVRLLVWILLAAALARPQHWDRPLGASFSGLDLMIALDVSASMQANDLPPSRLRAAQTVLAGQIPGWTQDRIGLILFSGTSQPVVPLTRDHDALLESLAAADAGESQLDGTALGDALQSAAGCLEAAREESKRPQAVILATDGNNNRGSDPEAVARKLHARGIRLYILGLGGRERIPRWEENPQGKWIPLRDGRGERQYWEPLHPDMLQRLAALAGGDFFSTQAPGEISLALEKIRVLEKRHSQSHAIPHTDKSKEWFAWPLGLALIFLALERGLRRTRWKGINA